MFRRRKILVALIVAFAVGIAMGLGLAGVSLYLLSPIPAPKQGAVAQASTVYDAGGKEVLGRFGVYDRQDMPLHRVPRHVRDAVIAAENRDFYDDGGISPIGIIRALWVDVTGGPLQGGSTISQQLVRNYYLTQERTLSRKIREAVLSLKINEDLSKDQILERYLNTIYFGRGTYGLQAAAHAYFGIDAAHLSLSQGAALAALIASPGRFDPATNRAGLTARMHYVLQGMVGMGKLSSRTAAAQKLPKFIKAKPRYGGTNGYILAAVEAELERRGVPPALIHAGGLRVVTTIRKDAQEAAVAAVKAQAPKSHAAGIRIGLAAVAPGTGDIVAIYGGANYTSGEPHSQENNAYAKIQPGSTFKPFALAAALEKGISLYDGYAGNSPLKIRGQPPVHNAGDRDWGSSISLLTATQNSVNTAYVDLSNRIGGARVADAAVRAGIPRSDVWGNTNPRLALGINAVSPVQMAGAYATFASGGTRAQPHLVTSVTGPHGDPVELPTVETQRAFTDDVARDVTFALERVVASGTAAAGTRGLGMSAAAKTGTHGGPRGIQSSWLVGYTPRLSAAVAMFRGDGNQILDGVGGARQGTAGNFAARIWTAFMRAALAERPVTESEQVYADGPPPIPPGTAPTYAAPPTRVPSPTSPAPAPRDDPPPTNEPSPSLLPPIITPPPLR